MSSGISVYSPKRQSSSSQLLVWPKCQAAISSGVDLQFSQVMLGSTLKKEESLWKKNNLTQILAKSWHSLVFEKLWHAAKASLLLPPQFLPYIDQNNANDVIT